MKSLLAACACGLVFPALAADPSETCFNSLAARASLAPLQQLVALGNIKNQSVDMMSNTRYPTRTEKEIIKAWVRERDQCFVIGDSWRQENMPANMRAILDTHYARNKLLIAELYQSRITYGEFGIQRAALSAQLTENLNAAWRERHARPVADPALEARQERSNAETRATMLATATRMLEQLSSSPSTGPSTPAACAGVDAIRVDEKGC